MAIRTECVTISGDVAGRIWWPYGVVQVVHATRRVGEDETPSLEQSPTLRDALVEMLSNGNFSECGFLPGSLYIVVQRGGRSRVWTVRGKCWATDDVFASNAIVDDWDEGGPIFEES
jgi:hypothetical protein